MDSLNFQSESEVRKTSYGAVREILGRCTCLLLTGKFVSISTWHGGGMHSTKGPLVLFIRSGRAAWTTYVSHGHTLISYQSSAVAEMGDRLSTLDVGRKVGAAVPLLGGGAGSPSNTMWPGSRPTPSYQVASSFIQPFDYNKHGRKLGAVPFFGGGGGPI